MMDIEKYVIRQAKIIREYCDYRNSNNLPCTTCTLKVRGICTDMNPVCGWDVTGEYEGTED